MAEAYAASRERDAPQLCQARRSSRTHFNRSASKLLSLFHEHIHTTHTYTSHTIPLFLFFSLPFSLPPPLPRLSPSTLDSFTTADRHASVTERTSTHKREARGISARTTNAHTDRHTRATVTPHPSTTLSASFSTPRAISPPLSFISLRLNSRSTRAYEPRTSRADCTSPSSTSSSVAAVAARRLCPSLRPSAKRNAKKKEGKGRQRQSKST